MHNYWRSMLLSLYSDPKNMRKPRHSSSSRAKSRTKSRVRKKTSLPPRGTSISPNSGYPVRLRRRKVRRKHTFRKRLRSLLFLLIVLWFIFAIVAKPVGYFLRAVQYSFIGWVRTEYLWIKPQTLADEKFQETRDLIDDLNSPGIQALIAAFRQDGQLWCTLESSQQCVQDLKRRLSLIYQDLSRAGINPASDPHAVINTLDLYQSGSRGGSRRFPQEYIAAKEQGKNSLEALVRGRLRVLNNDSPLDTPSFRKQCPPQQRKSDCLIIQQRDRVRAIQAILQPYLQPEFIQPTEGELSQGFHLYHEGIDLANKIGTPIIAAAEGEVIFSGWDEWGLGKLVKIRHKDGSTTVYGHNRELLVQKGEWVKQGQEIAKMGSSGNSTGPHLHFEIRIQGKAIDPETLVKDANNQ
ncbi:M23 family metallopeptidase [Spirulina sp. 06S082]|uniref:M23 family metallopeptidase n=1 Tax=Spirulina sp. 06S082 TaxID=3110248 RepID=UPI002B202B4D|nr:M23 family metallopeptidase [Spirulina sp. 06S082]MEA5469677.1 M23 family metallopeptidase [Spirulina sp. 06S082]